MEELGQGSGAWKRRQRQCGSVAVDTGPPAAVRQCGSGHRASSGSTAEAAAEGCVGRYIYGVTISQTVLN